MLFNSISFICLFLPVTLFFFFLFGRFHRRTAMAWLGIASIIFYSWLGTRFLPLLIFSIIFNYSVGVGLERFSARERLAYWLLFFGVSVNLLVLVYYKYLYDLTGWAQLHGLFPTTRLGSDILPLGISFFTFTQIGFLIDRKAGTTKARSFIEYLLFVTFFPHLIAGPILHHREIMPQFLKDATYRFSVPNFSVGLSIFIVGLAKKVLIADQFSGYVATGFGQAHDLTRLAAWCAALSYFIQLYFDFSGYSEMALGLARMFNVTFPANFDSPYKAPNIIEFWQRFHMSLTRYVTLYVYNPIALAITRRRMAKGKLANAKALRTVDGFAMMVALPTMVTMVLIGVWHGSGLQFLIFGFLHGFYLCTAHAWRMLTGKKKAAPKSALAGYASEIPAILLTCLAAIFALVFFRARTIPDAISILGAMTFWPAHIAAPLASYAGLLHPKAIYHAAVALSQGHLVNIVMIACALTWVWTMPNTLQLFAEESPALVKSRAQKPLINIIWRPAPIFGMGLGVLLLYSFLCVTGTTEFLYFRF